MKKIPGLLLLLWCMVSFQKTHGQSCPQHAYLDYQYDSVAIDTNVYYGSAVRHNSDTVDLLMDVYEPYEDSNSLRPLIVWVHGGGFMQGTKMWGNCGLV